MMMVVDGGGGAAAGAVRDSTAVPRAYRGTYSVACLSHVWPLRAGAELRPLASCAVADERVCRQDETRQGTALEEKKGGHAMALRGRDDDGKVR